MASCPKCDAWEGCGQLCSGKVADYNAQLISITTISGLEGQSCTMRNSIMNWLWNNMAAKTTKPWALNVSINSCLTLYLVTLNSSGIVLKQCQKLLWLDHTTSGCTLLMLTRGASICSQKYGYNIGPITTSCEIGIWELHTITRTKQLDVGIGQGNGAGPQIWVAVSMLLFKTLCQDGFITTLFAP